MNTAEFSHRWEFDNKQAVVHARLCHKRRVWGGGNTSPLKTAAWEARKITDKEISGKSHLARNRRQDP